MKNFTPRQRVMSVLRKEQPDKTPFTCYECMLPSAPVLEELRKKGLCTVYRTSSYHITTPDVKYSYENFNKNGISYTRTHIETPVGCLSSLHLNQSFTSWEQEHLFKTVEDYKTLLFIIQNARITSNYENALKLLKDLDEDYLIRDCLPLEPLQDIISSYMGTETFCYEWMDNRDEINKLYEALKQRNRKIYPIVADGPLETSNYGGNVVPQVIGKQTFIDYYIPNYNEAAEALHRKGKLIGTHLDADNTIIMEDIPKTELDYIEAYDPGSSPSVAVALKSFSDKVLWINWPSACHLSSKDEILKKTIHMIEEARPGNRFIIGITEDMPPQLRDDIMTYIMNAINENVF